jgi:hypothetical protein
MASVQDAYADENLGIIATYPAFVLVKILKSQTSTGYFSNSSCLSVTSNFPQVLNLNQLFLKLDPVHL